MDRRERFEDPEEMLRAAMDGLQARLWTALPGIVQSFDASAMTCVVQPSIQGRLTAVDGAETLVDMPLLPDVPVVFPGGGGCTLTFPVKAGDECLVIFAARGIDYWWQSGGVQKPAETRRHDLSDGFAIIGPRSKARAITSINTAAVELRSDDGQAYVRLDPAAHSIVATAPGGVTVTADTAIHGDLNVTGDLSGGADLTITGDGSFGGDVMIGGSLTVGSLAG
jgi:hypothetical protein